MAIATIAAKDLRLLLRDRRAAVILLAMPIVFMLVLGVALGEGFGQKPDDRLRISVVIDDVGPAPGDPPLPSDNGPPPRKWSDIVLRDLEQTAGIRVELIPTMEVAQRLVRNGERAAVLVFGAQFSARVAQCSFIDDRFLRVKGLNPFYRDGVNLAVLDLMVLRDPTQLAAASIIEQVAQVTMLRVVLPWMIGRAFEEVTTQLPLAAPVLKRLFSKYDLTAKTWSKLTLSEPLPANVASNASQYEESSNGLLQRGSMRYQILVPSLTVTFAFFLVVTAGGLFVAERREGTLTRLRLAPLYQWQILAGKLLPCLAVSVLQGFLLLIAGKFVFGMSWGTHPAWLFTVAICTAFAATGLALLVAGVARTEAQVAVYGTLLVLVLAGVSGCLMPRELMPETMKTWSRITPHAWALEAYNQLLLNPQPELATVATACGALLAFAAAFLILGWWRMRLD